MLHFSAWFYIIPENCWSILSTKSDFLIVSLWLCVCTDISISHLVVHYHQREKRKRAHSEEENDENSPTMEEKRAALSLQQLHKER